MLRFELLDEHHNVSAFKSRNTYLDDYLQNTALSESRSGVANTFLAIETTDDNNEEVVGYFTLASTAQYVPAVREDVAEADLYPAELRCLARDFARYGQGLGDVLLVQALRYISHAADYVGLPGVFLVATSEGVFLYERFGFLRLFPDKREFFLPINDIRVLVAVTDEASAVPFPNDVAEEDME